MGFPGLERGMKSPTGKGSGEGAGRASGGVALWAVPRRGPGGTIGPWLVSWSEYELWALGWHVQHTWHLASGSVVPRSGCRP